MIGQTVLTLIEGANNGRAYFDAPEIDGQVLLKHSTALKPGEIKPVTITGARAFDLIGHITWP